jgi:predicted Rdx family selenoprotein
LAATIERKFGLKPVLLEGHNGIFQVRVNGKSIWDNQSKCTRIPAEGEILALLRQHADPLPGEEIGEMVVFPVFPQS